LEDAAVDSDGAGEAGQVAIVTGEAEGCVALDDEIGGA
jgi:hypothetical protein